MNKAVICCIVMCAIVPAKGDWRIDAFLKSQEIFSEFEKEETEFLIDADPSTKPFYDLWQPMQEAHRERELVAFKYKIKYLPESINWDDVWSWSKGASSSTEHDLLMEACSEYAASHRVFLLKREALTQNKDLLKIRRDASKRYCEEFQVFSNSLDKKLEELQSDVEKKRSANMSLE